MPSQTIQYYFQKVTDLSVLDNLKHEWQKSLVAPQDDMWEAFTNGATHWEIKTKNQSIGYACVNDENRLLQFFVLPFWNQEGPTVFQQFIKDQNIKSAMIGTNNPVCLSLAMHFQSSVTVDTYLFTDVLDADPMKMDGTIRPVVSQELENLVGFYHNSIGAPIDWLNGYLGNLVEKSEVFILVDGNEILGACEVRKSADNPKVANVGMVVSPQHRKKGVGTFLLGKAKHIAKQWQRFAICSCEKDNIGSLKSIHNNGFRSSHQMLLMTF